MASSVNNDGFLRKQLVILSGCVPAFYLLIFFPFALLVGLSLLSQPLYALAILSLLAAYITLAVLAWRGRSFLWTTLFVLLSLAPVVGHLIVLPELQKSHFRSYRQIPDDAEILYYRESGLRDVTRFCLIQHPRTSTRKWSSSYRPFLAGALGIMHNVQQDLGIPDSKMPDPNKQTVTYSGGENESAPGAWMFLDVVDSETKREWIFEYGY